MTIQEQLTQIVERIDKADSIIPFLLEQDDPSKRTLVPTIKKLYKYYGTYITEEELNEHGYHSYSCRGSQAQLLALQYACFFCMNQTDFERTIRWLSEEFYEVKLHDLFSPSWFSDYANTQEGRASYQQHMHLYQAGYFTWTAELVASKLVNAILLRIEGTHESRYSLEALYLDPVTLQEHIWCLFTQHSSINWSDRWVSFKDEQDEGGWKQAFATLIGKGEVDRQRVLRECLLCASRNYDKTHTGWFFDLFVFLTPTTTELLALQEKLFLVMGCPHSKPINNCLKYIKSLCVETGFETEAFLETVPLLLTAEVKTVVNSTLMILDKIAKQQPALQVTICELTTEAFLQKDEKIQQRVAKLIIKYGKPSEGLNSAISMYHGELFTTVKTLLADFYSAEPDDGLPVRLAEPAPFQPITPDNLLPTYASADEMIFFISQVFENNENWHFDAFIDVLPRLYKQLSAEEVSKLEPAFQRALTALDAYSNRIGYLENLMALAFVNTIPTLVERFPTESKNIKQHYQHVIQHDLALKKERPEYEPHIRPLSKLLKTHWMNPVYYSFVARLMTCQRHCEHEEYLTPLALPTHIPCWLTLSTLIKRLMDYQQSGQQPGLYDFQIAVSRVVLDGQPEILLPNHGAMLNQLAGETQALMLYLTGKQAFKVSECKTPSLWLAVIYRKGNQADLEQLLEQHDIDGHNQFMAQDVQWEVIRKKQKYKEFNYKTRKNETVIRENKSLVIEEPSQPRHYPESDDVIERFGSFYHHFFVRRGTFYDSSRPEDDLRFMYLAPHKPDLIVKRCIAGYLGYTNWSGVEEELSSFNLLGMFAKTWNNCGPLRYLFLACMLLYIKKAHRQLAAEIWIQAVTDERMDNHYLGQCLGRLEHGEYAPIKRLTDLLLDQLLNLSQQHNKTLLELTSSMIAEMNVRPIKGNNKLLEIYLDLLQTNDEYVMPQAALDKIKQWAENQTLRKLARDIVKCTEAKTDKTVQMINF